MNCGRLSTSYGRKAFLVKNSSLRNGVRLTIGMGLNQSSVLRLVRRMSYVTSLEATVLEELRTGLTEYLKESCMSHSSRPSLLNFQLHSERCITRLSPC